MPNRLPASRSDPRPLSRSRSPVILSLLMGLGVAGCALQGPYLPPSTVRDGTRLASSPVPPSTRLDPVLAWWAALDDPAVDQMIEAALSSNPDLDRAVALIDLARAEAGAARAARSPSVGLDGTVSRETTSPAPRGEDDAQTVAGAGLNLSWEVDLFGRVRSGVEASRARLDSRIAEADAVRLILATDVAAGVTGLRACRVSEVALETDIASRRIVLDLTRRRRDAGFDADVDVGLAQTGLATAETALALRRQDCGGLVNALILLTGTEEATVAASLFDAPFQPPAPPLPPSLPARILRSSPPVMAAERAAEAAWADIGVARAERWPRVDLTAALTGQWLTALGSTTGSSGSALGLGLTLPMIDGGRGAAAVAGGEARYAAALADLDAVLRVSARDVRNALAAAASARSRQASALDAAEAAAATLRAREAQWRAGAVSQFELEDARRQAFATQDSVIAASRDATQAWIALVRAAGPEFLLVEPS